MHIAMQKCVIGLALPETLLSVFQVLDEMPWLSESDIKDIPPVLIPICLSTISYSYFNTRHGITFTTWQSIMKLQKCAIIISISSIDYIFVQPGHPTIANK